MPIRYNDLEDRELSRLPERVRDEVKSIQWSDFSSFTALVNPKADSNIGHQFRQAVETLCKDSLVPAIEQAPPFRDDWPRLPEQPWTGRDARWKARL